MELRSGEFSGIGLGGALAVFAALLAGCSGADEESTVLKLSVETAPGVVRFDKQRLSAKAGRIAFELTNDNRKGHNVRIHTGDRCCFRAGSKDIGGTRTIGPGRTRVVLDLKPGTYTPASRDECASSRRWNTDMRAFDRSR